MGSIGHFRKTYCLEITYQSQRSSQTILMIWSNSNISNTFFRCNFFIRLKSTFCQFKCQGTAPLIIRRIIFTKFKGSICKLSCFHENFYIYNFFSVASIDVVQAVSKITSLPYTKSLQFCRSNSFYFISICIIISQFCRSFRILNIVSSFSFYNRHIYLQIGLFCIFQLHKILVGFCFHCNVRCCLESACQSNCCITNLISNKRNTSYSTFFILLNISWYFCTFHINFYFTFCTVFVLF